MLGSIGNYFRVVSVARGYQISPGENSEHSLGISNFGMAALSGSAGVHSLAAESASYPLPA